MIKLAEAKKLAPGGKMHRVWGRATRNPLRFGGFERSRRRLLSSASASALGLAAISSAILLLPARSALAQTVQPGQNIATVVPPPAPANTTLTLAGNVTLFDPNAVNPQFPYGFPGPLTINGNGNTITLNDGAGHFGFFNGTGSPTTLTLNDVTMTGGSHGAGAGGAIHSGNGLMIPITGTVTFAGNQAGSSEGGAIGSEGAGITISGPGATLNVRNNAESVSGGGIGTQTIGTLAPITITVGTANFSGNTAAAAGGAVFANEGDVTVNAGALTLMGNTANFGGGLFAGQSGFNAAAPPGSIAITANTMTIQNNTALVNSGGALAAILGGVTVNANGPAMISGNTAGADGGAIFAGTSAAAIAVLPSSGNVTLNANGPGPMVISGNAAGGRGGAIFAGTSLTLNASATTTLSGNTAGGNGGAIFLGAGVSTLNALGPAGIALTGNSAGGFGGAIFLDAGSLNLNADGNITFSGNTQAGAPNAIFVTNEPGSVATVTFNASAGSQIDFFDPIASNAANGLVTVNKIGAGIVSFDGSQRANDSQIYANTTVSGGTFEIAHNAVYGETAADAGVATGPSTFITAPGTTLQGGVAGTVRVDEFTLGGTLNIAGRTTPGAPFSNFTISGGTAMFQPGSQVLFNTFLGTDGSPSDLLIINGAAASGLSLVRVTNVGGPGALTTGNGILLVNAIGGATTAPGTFVLGNPELRAGEFDYRLFQGGLNGSDPNDWFLRSTFVGPEPVEPLLPIIGPELATYGVVQPLARQLGLTMLGTLHERIGDTLTSANVAPASLASGVDPSVWGRVFGQQIKNHYDAFADPRADGSMIGFQSGFDLFRGSIVPIDGHRDAAGLYFAYGNTAVDVNGLVTNAAATNFVLTKTGTVNFNAYTMGGYWTHYGPTDWYIDAVVQGTFYQGNATTQFASLPLNGSGFASSLEGGYPIPLPWFGPRFVLEPEAQIIWQRVSFDDTNDGLGPVALGDTSGASGRIGLRGQWTIVSGEPVQPQIYRKAPTKTPQLWWPQVWQPYWVVNLWRDWGADAATSFGGDLVPLSSQATRLDLAAGLTARISTNVSLYGQAGYQFAISDTSGSQRDGVKGDLGLRVTW